MATFEEKLANLADMRARVLDPDQPDPTDDEICQAVADLHQTRGAAATKKANKTPVITDLNALFGDSNAK